MVDDFFDPAYTGEQLLSVVQTLGESIIFFKGEETELPLLACFNDSISTADLTAHKVFKSTGEMTFPDRISQETLRGEYFERISMPDKVYILASTTGNPYSDFVANVEALECNQAVTVGYETVAYNPATGNEEMTFNARHIDVRVYLDTTAKQPQQTEVGDIPKQVITIVIPVKYPVTTSDVILIREFVSVGNDVLVPMYTEQKYDVISVNATFMDTKDDIAFFGVLYVDLVKRV